MKKTKTIIMLISLALAISACDAAKTGSYTMAINESLAKASGIRPGYGTMYEVFVYSFCDSDGDGIGDINGLISRLDYISDLGFDGIWLMPIMPSPTYHKYDVTDYYAIDPAYGTMADFESLLSACNERGIRVIIDLVLNHSSAKHPWFLEATRYLAGLDGKEPSLAECPELDFYNFRQERKSGYHKVEGTDDWYYEGVFWSGMPDLNLASEKVRAEIENIAAFWLEKGVAGFRLDAAKEFFTGYAESNIEVLFWFNQMVKEKKPDAYLVAEVWESALVYAPYYGSGIDSIFNFAFANQNGIISETVRGKKAASAFGAEMVMHDERAAAHNPDYIDAPFYTNHDLGRSAGYYNGEFALAQTKMALALNLLMSGNTFIYYGDELGMNGSGKDENKRLPMYWQEDENAAGMCIGPPDKENVKKRYPSYEIQKEDPLSMFAYAKNALKIRNAFPEIMQGKVVNLPDIGTDTIAAFTKTDGDSTVTIIANISPDEAAVAAEALSGDSGTASSRPRVVAVLLTDEVPVTMKDGMLTLPGYSIAILK
jgi:glycosidase